MISEARALRRPAATARIPQRLPAESLLAVPLVARALSDRRVVPVERAIDTRWAYARIVPKASPGFNPFAGQLFFSSTSQFARWRRRPQGSARPHNLGDRLVREVLFYVHDYLHAWAYGLLRSLLPDREIGFGAISDKNFEDLAFLHLLTEAVATVGLDYWYLSTVTLNDVCPIGTTIAGLTTSYREADLPEYRRARPDLEVQSPGFFAELTHFYCTGELLGFDARDLIHSAKLYAWLDHEITYGVAQRTYSRAWLGYLRGAPVSMAEAGRPVACDKPWQRRVIRDVGDALWALVKQDQDTNIVPIDPGDMWRSPVQQPLDPRFTNLDDLDPDAIVRFGAHDPGDVSLAMEQHLLRYDHARFDRHKLVPLREALARRDLRALRWVLHGERMLPRRKGSPRDLLVVP